MKNESLKIRIKETIIQHCDDNNIKQIELAKKLGWTRQRVNKLFKGHLQDFSLDILAEALDKLSYFFIIVK